MKRKILVLSLITMYIMLAATPTVYAASTTAVLGGGVCINEVLVDPNDSSGDNFDTDGSGAANDPDEFVELYNLSGSAVDISGWELWDAGYNNWFTFDGTPNSGTTVLQPGAYAVVIGGVQAGGSLPTMTNPNSMAFDAGRGSGVLNNDGDNVVLYDPNLDQYIQIRYNGDTADDPPNDYTGFSGTATLVGSVEDFGSDQDGNSLTRYPSGDTAVGIHDTIVPGGALASPNAVTLGNIAALPTSSITAVALAALVGGAGLVVSLRRKRV